MSSYREPEGRTPLMSSASQWPSRDLSPICLPPFMDTVISSDLREVLQLLSGGDLSPLRKTWSPAARCLFLLWPAQSPGGAFPSWPLNWEMMCPSCSAGEPEAQASFQKLEVVTPRNTQMFIHQRWEVVTPRNTQVFIKQTPVHVAARGVVGQ